jgi:hypothetical protein
MRLRHYILDGLEPIEVYNLMLWARWMEIAGNRRIAMDHVGAVCVSTVFLGTDHSWSDKGPPILFETMMFIEDDGRKGCSSSWGDLQLRAATWEEAITNHELARQEAAELMMLPGHPPE